MVFYCNPNNPVATAVGGKEHARVSCRLSKARPNTHVLVDEAYFEYATMPGYETMIPLAIENPRVVVARTFSKCFGMAGLRIGYAIGHKDTIKKMADWDGIGAVNVLGLQRRARALSLRQGVPGRREEAQHRGARVHAEVVPRSRLQADRFADQLHVRGHQASGRGVPRRLRQGKRPRRPRLPALREERTARISVGTMDEMQSAVKVFEKALASSRYQRPPRRFSRRATANAADFGDRSADRPCLFRRSAQVSSCRF